MRRALSPAKFALATACLVASLSCGDNPAGPAQPTENPPSSGLPQLLKGVGASPAPRPNGTVPTILGKSGRSAEIPPVGEGGEFSLSTAQLTVSTSHSRHILLENSASGARALWVISNGSIVSSASLGTMPASWRIVGSGDYNADGFEDILWDNTGEAGNGSRAVWLMDGAGGVLAAVSLGTLATDWHIAGGGDYNGDGKDDILLENISTGVRAIWIMNGGTVTGVVVIGTLFDWHMIAARDLNSDGKDDILLEHTTNGSKVLWMMSGGAVEGAVLLGVLPLEWHISATTDIDGDTHTDVVLENRSTGARAAWLEDGHGGVTSAPLLTYLDPVWHMAAALVPNRAAPVMGFLSVQRLGSGWGGVTSAPAGINCGTDCSEFYEVGSVVTLTATPAPGSTFTGWSGEACTGIDTCTVNMAEKVDVSALFSLTIQSLVVNRAGNGSGTVTSSPSGIDCGVVCTGRYDYGTEVTLTANPAPGSTFTGWTGNCSGLGTCTVTLTGTVMVTATFTLNPYILTVMRNGTGPGMVTSNPAGIDCGADCSEPFTTGTVVTLTAIPSVESTFTGWSGGGCSGTGTCTLTMTGATTVTAMFTLGQFNLTVIRSGNGAGTVTSTPGGISCGTDCSEIYNYGLPVTLTATPATGSTFAGWSGGCTGTGTCSTTMTSARTITAVFTLNQYSLSVTRAGGGSGTVTSSPAGINCGVDCSEPYNYSSVVTLTASASTGSTFAGWLGGGCTGIGTCTLTVLAATSVTATFTLNQYVLSANKAGSGSGTVTSNPAGISCGTDCTQSYNYGTSVTLTAAAATGSTFTGWAGGGCTGIGSCTVVMTAATTVTATFVLSDVTAPTLVSSTPADAAIGVPTNGTIRLTFSEAMNQPQTQAAFQVSLPTGVTGTFSWQGNTMVFTPSAQFSCTAAGTVVQWSLSTAARDLAGNPIAATTTRSFRVIRCLAQSIFADNTRDGYVTNIGTVNSTGASIYVGDYTNNTFARGFVSFDFSVIPSNAVITQAFMHIYTTRLVGVYQQLNTLVAEPVSYGTLDATDFLLPTLGPAAVGVAGTILGYWELSGTMTDAWNTRGTRGTLLQLRLRTTFDYYINAQDDGYDFKSVEGGGVSNAPYITVSYQAP